MKVCLICEGCYPYIPGGVSSWIQTICTQFPDISFVIWSIATTKKEMSEYRYQIPANVVEIRTVYLGEEKWGRKNKEVRLRSGEKEILKNLLLQSAQDIDWKNVLEFLSKYRKNLCDVLMSEAFFEICLEEYQRQNSHKVFNHFLWNIRGMYFPLMYLLSEDIPKADIYHCVSTGYAGIMGSCASYIKNRPLIVSEHGIYTREREEDIIRSDWVSGDFKNIWISFFKKISYIAYLQATVVTTLFEVNRTLQEELGCPSEKIVVIPNGVEPKDFENLPICGKLPNDKFQIGTVLRVVPIKDVKTMLMAFDLVKTKIAQVQLNIMGNVNENPEYYQECLQLIKELNIQDVAFLGQVNIKEYLSEIKLLLLSSISEGQPLAILEGMAAGIPFIATNVGDCKGLLMGEASYDRLGKAGIVVPVMNSQAMAEAILYCIRHPEEREKMGKVGQERVVEYYQRDCFIEKYRELYDRLGG